MANSTIHNSSFNRLSSTSLVEVAWVHRGILDQQRAPQMGARAWQHHLSTWLRVPRARILTDSFHNRIYKAITCNIIQQTISKWPTKIKFSKKLIKICTDKFKINLTWKILLRCKLTEANSKAISVKTCKIKWLIWITWDQRRTLPINKLRIRIKEMIKGVNRIKLKLKIELSMQIRYISQIIKI